MPALGILFGIVIDYTLHPTSNYLDYSKEAIAAQFAFLVIANGVFYIPLTRYLGWIVSNYHVGQVWRSMCLFPLIFVPLLSSLFPHEYRRMYRGRFSQLYLVTLLCLACFILLIYFLFYKITYTYVRQQKIEHSNRILSLQGSQYQQLLRSVQENNRIRHDLRQQLIVISELLKQKEYAKLEEYVQTYVDSTETKIRLYSYSAAVNALISYYESLCQDKGIQTDLSVYLPEGIPISDQDLCILLGNLLENAIYGCQDTEDPYIHLKILYTQAEPGIFLFRPPQHLEESLPISSQLFFQPLTVEDHKPGLFADICQTVIQRVQIRPIPGGKSQLPSQPSVELGAVPDHRPV